MRASRTGVINLKPIGRTATIPAAATVAAVVTNYLDARDVRVVNAVGEPTRKGRELPGTLQVQLAQPLRYVPPASSAAR